MKSAPILVVVLLVFSIIPSLIAGEEGLLFSERPGVHEFSGKMIARPLQVHALTENGLSMQAAVEKRLAAAERLDPWRIRYDELLDMHIIDIPEGMDENRFARELMASGDYEYVTPDWVCYPIGTTPNDPYYNQQWHHPKINSPEAWDLFTGDSNLIAAFVDTGVDKDHPDLQSHLIPGYNSVDRLTEAQGGDVNDIHGHGTAVAGCIGAIGNNGIGVAGMNWSLKLMPIRTTNDSSGSADMSDLTHGAVWAAQNGAKTISVSYSGVSDSAVGTAGTTVKGLGSLLIWAAGNEYSQLSGFDWTDVIVAGATDQNDAKADFSNYGVPIDVMAPGVSVMSTQNGGGYNAVSGTSFSAPLTNGLCALIWGYNTAQTANEVEQALFDGCMDMGNPTFYGHGRIDAYASLDIALPAIKMTFPSGVPAGIFPPGPATDVTVKIEDGFENYVPGSGRLHYRFDAADPYTAITVSSVGGDLYEVTIPNTRPGDEPEFYFSAAGDGGTTFYSPSDAPSHVYSFDVCFVALLMEDDFETNLGWTVQNSSVDNGAWERAAPASTDAQPGSDHSPVGTKCYVTGPLAGSSVGSYDLDGGPTRLISPVLDLSGGDATIRFYHYFYHTDYGGQQPLEIHVTNNGSSWIKVADVTHSPSWTLKSFQVSDYVTPTANVQVRISANDNPNDDIVEALVDDFRVDRCIVDVALWADAYSIPVSTGKAIDFSLDADAANSGRPFLLLASLSGTSPGFALPGGATLPLNWDALTDLILLCLGTPICQNFLGNLDGNGEAVATFDTLGPLDASLIGNTVNFAFMLGSPFNFVSNPIPVILEP
ncbi:MAG: S8 family serine peptidase [Planctomycetota bacterium]